MSCTGIAPVSFVWKTNILAFVLTTRAPGRSCTSLTTMAKLYSSDKLQEPSNESSLDGFNFGVGSVGIEPTLCGLQSQELPLFDEPKKY